MLQRPLTRRPWQGAVWAADGAVETWGACSAVRSCYQLCRCFFCKVV
ncbi:hypothetical protein M3J09_002559 [Ascochyta lentis]